VAAETSLLPKASGTRRARVVGVRVDPVSPAEAVRRVIEWAQQGESRYVCVANVHMLMEARDTPPFRHVLERADLVVPDGMPLVWMLRRTGFPGQQRVYGPALMDELCREAARAGVPIGLYGGTRLTLARLERNLRRRHPGLRIAYAWSPPFRPLTAEEDEGVVRDIRSRGVRLLFVGLGCPKQERWMASHRGRIPAVMVGVGAAFDLHAGVRRQAPRWMQAAGLEWLFRLLQEPRRLWRRYLKHNPRFVILACGELVASRWRRG